MKYLILILLGLNSILLYSQSKKIISVNDCKNWKSIKNYDISNNGRYVIYDYSSEKGDNTLFLIDNDKNVTKTFFRAKKTKISTNNDFIVFKIAPQVDSLRKAKFKKVKKNKLPGDSLGIYIFKKDTLIKINKLLTFNIPNDSSSWIIYKQNIKPEIKKIDKPKKKLKGKKLKKYNENKKIIEEFNKKQKKQKGKKFTIYNPILNKHFTFENVDDFSISKNGKIINFIVNVTDSIDSTYVYEFNTQNLTVSNIFKSTGTSKNITCSNNNKFTAFTFSADTCKNKIYSLKLYDILSKKLTNLIDSNTSEFPNKWSVNNNQNLYFSKNSEILFFGIAPNPKKEIKDSLLEEEKCKLDIWNYKDLYIMPEQLKNLKQDLKKTHLSDYIISSKKINILTDTIVDKVYTHNFNNGKYAIAINKKPNLKSHSWILPFKKDFYIVNTYTGKREFIDSTFFYINISPDEKFAYWFGNDSAWYVKNLNNKKTYSLTKKINTKFYNEDNDIPEIPWSYSIAGWTNNDKYILIYDKYDIWKIDPLQIEKPVNLTNSRKQKIINRLYKLDFEKLSINPNEPLLIKTFNEKNKVEGFYYLYLNGDKNKKLITHNSKFTYPKKAKNANKIIWRKQNFNKYPELNISNTDFTKIKTLSNVDTVIQKYNWGNVKIVKWKSFKGDTISGLLYTPEDLDSTKKYPMIVYFYEKYSDDINRFYTPRPSHSVINFPFFVSNDYIIFIPDIKYYNNGTPGDDAYNSVVSGTQYLLTKYKFINRDKLGLQGQSWGGFQVAYLVTKTNLYAAAMAGAPVSNMTSAYGGIRWGTGMSRMFQYETGQSRIGKTLWNDINLYIKNSPLFFANNVSTPLLIMHNDKDGAVPWYQGIEYFMALRRLGKKVWLLNYNGDNHNLMKWPNRIDISRREIQFFDYYLKDTKAPVWIDKGIPATKKGKDFGFEFVK